TDNGENWIWHNDGLNADYVRALATSGNTIFASGNRGLYASTNNGEDWSLIKDYINVSSILIHDKKTYIGAATGVFISTDNGVSWNKGGFKENDVLCLATNGNEIFAGSGYLAQSGASTNAGVYRSTDQGATWIHLDNNSLHIIPTSLAAHDKTVITGSQANWIFHSIDNGDNWTSTDKRVGVFVLFVNDSTFFAGTWYGVYRSNDGIVWTQFTNELSKSLVHSLAAHGKTLFAGTDEGVYVSYNNADSWIPLLDGLNGIRISSLTVNDNILFAGTYGGSVWKATISFLSSAEEQIYNHTELTLTLSPNPNNGILHISLNNEDTDIPLWVEIFSMHGEKIIEYTTEQNSFTLDINALPNGMYYLLARKGNRSQRQVLSVVR
ncbi:MAG: T9SS type A sorting domain-containing protein, partial [Candidatus Kapabacteria bacterium]|nr:T9SS type A sorting domain-containing protein [Candidatus Kapabacteria bacterium]